MNEQEIVDRLKQNEWTAHGGLSKEAKTFLSDHAENIEARDFMGAWKPMDDEAVPSDGIVYRLPPGFELPYGGLFIPTPNPPDLDTIVHVGISVDGAAVQPMVLECRIVHRMEATQEDAGETNLLVGIGVQFTDTDRAISLLRSFMS